jgi:prephenate dehydrogenase
VLTRPVTVTDVGSTKRTFMDAARALPPHITVMGGHPLAGAAAAGLAHASAAIFEGRPWLLVDGAGGDAAAHDQAKQQVMALVSGLGAHPQLVTAEEHDLLVAWLSHLPQLAASTLLDVIGSHVGGEGLALAGRGLRDTTRLAASPFGVWADIIATNRDYIDLALGDLEREIGSLRRALEDPATLEAVFTRARGWREALE